MRVPDSRPRYGLIVLIVAAGLLPLVGTFAVFRDAAWVFWAASLVLLAVAARLAWRGARW